MIIENLTDGIQLDRHQTSLAIVGNAKSLFGKNQGYQIDHHDCIMRLNYGKIIDSSQQGSRTDLYGCSDDKLTAKWIIDNISPKLIIWLTNKKIPDQFYNDENINLYINKQRDWEEAQSFVKPARPSSGAIAVSLLKKNLGVEDIHLYGFDFFQSPTFYHKKSWRFWKVRKKNPHLGEAEFDMMQKLGIIVH